MAEKKTTKKKGTAMRRDRLSVANKPSGFRLRWCDRDAMNVANRLEDGWVFIDRTKGIPVEPDEDFDGKVPDGVHVRRELVLMGLPEDLAKDRESEIQDATNTQVASIKRRAQSSMTSMAGPDANVYGSVKVIE